MNWDAISAVAELVGSLAVIATVGYTAVQIRQNSKLVAPSVEESIRDGLNETTRILASDRETARVFWAGLADRASLADDERFQFDALLSLTFAGQQQAFVAGKLTEAGFQWILRFPGTQDWWATYSSTLSRGFQTQVDRMLEEYSPAAVARSEAPSPSGGVT